MSILSKIFGRVETKVVAAEQPIATTRSKKLRRRKPPKRLTEAERNEAIGLLKETVRRNGYRVISVSKLVQAFGYQKRSIDNINQITAWLAAQHLTVHPELSLHLKPAESVRIYGFPVVQLGDLFTAILSPEEALAKPKFLRQQRERELEEYIKQHEHYRQLGLQDPERQHSPQHTRDRFDFLCRDCDGNPVVLELKHQGGEKRP